MKRTQFTVYESFYKAIARMKKKSDQADTFRAMSELALYGVEPDLDLLSDNVAAALELILPHIRTANRKSEAGRVGGLSNGRTEAETKQS